MFQTYYTLADNGKDALISLPADYDDFETGDDHEGNRIVLSWEYKWIWQSCLDYAEIWSSILRGIIYLNPWAFKGSISKDIDSLWDAGLWGICLGLKEKFCFKHVSWKASGLFLIRNKN